MRPVASFILPATLVLCAVLSAGAGAQRGGQPVSLPDGPGRDAVQNTCSTCHGLNLIAGSLGNARAGWRELFGSMIALPPAEADVVSTYLATHFPPKPAPEAVLIQGPASVTFKEWVVPSLGSRPHDPLAARDGSIWWTGMF